MGLEQFREIEMIHIRICRTQPRQLPNDQPIQLIATASLMNAEEVVMPTLNRRVALRELKCDCLYIPE